MYIRSRSQVEEFSSFIEFVNDSNQQRVQWRSDGRLSRNIARILVSDDYRGIGTKGIVLTFLKDLQKNYNLVTHSYLVAYLHKICFKTCVAIFQDFKKLRNFPDNLELEQLFLEANSLLWQKDIFDRYDFQSSKIDTYITGILKNKLLDSRARILGDASRRSVWGLLKEVSQIKTNRALDILEIPSPRNRSDYFNLINLYKNVCTSTKGLREEDSSFKLMMESIAEWFNRLGNISSSGNIMSSEEVIEILKNCAKAIRQLDSVQRQFSPEDSDVFDTIPSVQSFSCLDQLIDLVSNYLGNSLEADLTNPSHKTMRINDVFVLYHGLGYKDAKIGVMYNCNQSTISRFRSKAYAPILSVLRDWYSKIAVKSFDDPHLIKMLSEALDAIYHEKLNETLHMICNDTLDVPSLAILSELYELKNKRNSSNQNLIQEIADKQGVLAVHIEETIKQMQFVLSDALVIKLKEIFDSNLSIDSKERKVYEFVESWIGILIE